MDTCWEIVTYPEHINEGVALSPHQSYLYHLAPIYNGPYTESLTSYISRLSEAHGLSMADFLKEVLSLALQKPYLHATVKHGGTRFFAYSGALNGLGRGAGQLAEELHHLTKVDNLQRLTFLPFQELLSDRGLIRRFRSWCPQCYQKWIENDMPVYDPLLWSVQNIEYCPVHRTQLVQTCPKCGRHLFHLERYSRPGYCTCGNWLGNSGTIVDQVGKISNDLNNPNNTIELLHIKNIGTAIELAQEELSSHISVQQIMSHLLTLTHGNMASLARRAELPKSTLFGWTQNRRIPLNTLIYLTERLNLELKDILLFTPLHTIPASETSHSPKTVLSRHRQHAPSPLQKAEQLLEVELRAEPPNSLQNIAKRIGLDRKLLRTKFPILSEQIRDRYREFIHKQKETRIFEVSYEIRACIHQLSKQGIYPSRRQVERVLGRPAILHESRLQKIWKEEIMKLYLVDKIQIQKNCFSSEPEF